MLDAMKAERGLPKGRPSLSIFKLEGGQVVRPRASQIQALAAVRSLTRAEIQERLSSA